MSGGAHPHGDCLRCARERTELAAALREVERLTACLKRANDQAEHFEREWYLRGDELEKVTAERDELRTENERLKRKIDELYTTYDQLTKDHTGAKTAKENVELRDENERLNSELLAERLTNVGKVHPCDDATAGNLASALAEVEELRARMEDARRLAEIWIDPAAELYLEEADAIVARIISTPAPVCGKCGEPWTERHANVTCGGAGLAHPAPAPAGAAALREVAELRADLELARAEASGAVEAFNVLSKLLGWTSGGLGSAAIEVGEELTALRARLQDARLCAVGFLACHTAGDDGISHNPWSGDPNDACETCHAAVRVIGDSHPAPAASEPVKEDGGL